MGKFQVTPILKLIENLTENICVADIDMTYGQIMRTTNVGKSLIDIGKSFIPSDSSPLGKNHKNFWSVSKYFLSNGLSIFSIIWYFHDPN